MTDPVLIDRRDAVAWLTLNRPEAGNAIDAALARRLRELVEDVADDTAVRCVVLQGGGRLFCAGGDVSALHAAGAERPRLLRTILTDLHPAIAHLARMEKPVITAINGPAAGAGLVLAAVGDMALAAPEAHFTMAYSRIGLSPDAGTSWLLPRLIGLRRTQELALTNRRVSAPEAESMGLVTRVLPKGELEAAVVALAHELVDGATAALGATKRLLLASGSASLDEALDAEREQIVAQGGSSESAEGFAALVERRTPAFRIAVR